MHWPFHVSSKRPRGRMTRKYEFFSRKEETRGQWEGVPRWGMADTSGTFKKGVRSHTVTTAKLETTSSDLASGHFLAIDPRSVTTKRPTCNYRCIVCIIRPWYMHSRGIDRRRTRTISEIWPRHRNREFFDSRLRNALLRTVVLLLKIVSPRRIWKTGQISYSKHCSRIYLLHILYILYADNNKII